MQLIYFLYFALYRYKSKVKGACFFDFDNPTADQRKYAGSFINMVSGKIKGVGIGYAKRTVYLSPNLDGKLWAKRVCLFLIAYYERGATNGRRLSAYVKKGSFNKQAECQNSNDDYEDEEYDFAM